MLFFSQLKPKELTGSILALPLVERLLLALPETLVVAEDELDPHLLGIDLERSIEGLPLLGGHALYFDNPTLYEILALLVRELYPFDLLGDGYSVGT